ncbi:MAG: hypothetical protein LBJ76_07060 [Candidatus Accumulibacter sp.]|nr:hypothetical protein [Accumulibacter sp.]
MSAFIWRSGDLVGEGDFPPTEDGLREFGDYLGKHSDSVFSLLADVAEEGIHIETIPFLQGADREAVIARRLGQSFFSTHLTASQSLGYLKTQRKDERVLLLALTNNDFFAPWFNAFTTAGIMLSGVYSPPLLAESLLKKNGIKDEFCLLLTIQGGSLRQIYLEKGELRFSRLAAIKDDQVSGIARTISVEAIKLQQYLDNQRQAGSSRQPIAAYIVSREKHFDTIRDFCADTGMIRFKFLDIDQCSRKAGLTRSVPEFHAEWIFLGLMAVSPPAIQFAGDDLRHNYHLDLTKMALYGVGSTLLMACLAFAGSLLYDRYTLLGQADALKAEARIFRERYEAIAKTFPPMPIDHDTLRTVIGQYVDLEKKSLSPEGLYTEISRALQHAPSIEIDAIHWKIGSADSNTTSEKAFANMIRVPDDSESALVLGTIRLGPQASPRQMLAMFDRFVEAGRQIPDMRVEVLKRPFDVEPEKALKGNDTTLGENQPRSFVVQFLRKIGT